jgi:putative peptidoglycan lipid II flippase
MAEATAPRSEATLGRSAGILGLGNVASRVVGLARESVISFYFGSSGELSAFNLASRVPAMLYDLLVGGMLSAALVPVFSDYARPGRREDLVKVASAMLSLIAVVMGAIVILLELFAAPIANILGDFEDPALQLVLQRCLRLIAPSVLLFGLSGGVTGLLYALRRFSITALSGAVFNLGIVLAAPLLANRIGVYALPIGVAAGSLMQLAVMSPGLRGLGLRPSLAWNHPGVRRILRLYVPIALGLIVTQIQIIVDGRWASATGASSVSWMRYATTLIQMPLGLVPVAISLAALPSLAQRAADSDWEAFRSLFARGLRMLIVLLLPATAGLFVLAMPVISLLFQHGSFTSADTDMTATALRLYLIGLPFAGVDFLLNYTFYARQDTRTPAIVGVIAVGFYFVAAWTLKERMGYLGLVLADSIKQAGHATIMTGLLMGTVGRPERQGILRTAARASGASLVMGIVVGVAALVLARVLPSGLVSQLALVLIPATIGAGLYLLLLRAARVAEADALTGIIARRFARTFAR